MIKKTIICDRCGVKYIDFQSLQDNILRKQMKDKGWQVSDPRAGGKDFCRLCVIENKRVKENTE